MPSPGPPCMHHLLRSLGTTPPSESDWDAVLAKDGELPSPERAKRVVQPPTTGRWWITRTTRTGRWRRTNQTTLWRGRAEFRRRLGFMRGSLGLEGFPSPTPAPPLSRLLIPTTTLSRWLWLWRHPLSDPQPAPAVLPRAQAAAPVLPRAAAPALPQPQPAPSAPPQPPLMVRNV